METPGSTKILLVESLCTATNSSGRLEFKSFSAIYQLHNMHMQVVGHACDMWSH